MAPRQARHRGLAPRNHMHIIKPVPVEKQYVVDANGQDGRHDRTAHRFRSFSDVNIMTGQERLHHHSQTAWESATTLAQRIKTRGCAVSAESRESGGNASAAERPLPNGIDLNAHRSPTVIGGSLVAAQFNGTIKRSNISQPQRPVLAEGRMARIDRVFVNSRIAITATHSAGLTQHHRAVQPIHRLREA